MTPEELLADGSCGVKEGAKFLGIGQTFLYAEMEAGLLRYVKLGKRRLIPWRELTRYAAAALQGGGALEALEQGASE
jgi:excisionase family DNA binding protein